MAINFPASLDTLTNPTSGDNLDTAGVVHADQHSDLNDAVEALQSKVGIDSSAEATSHDYRISALRNRTPWATLSYPGQVVYFRVPHKFTVTGWEIVATGDAPVSTTAVVDVWLDTGANYPPTNADSIAGTEKPTLTAATRATDTSLSTWTDTSFEAGDYLGFECESISGGESVTVYLLGVQA